MNRTKKNKKKPVFDPSFRKEVFSKKLQKRIKILTREENIIAVVLNKENPDVGTVLGVVRSGKESNYYSISFEGCWTKDCLSKKESEQFDKLTKKVLSYIKKKTHKKIWG